MNKFQNLECTNRQISSKSFLEEVALVLSVDGSADAEAGTRKATEAVVLNRPLATTMTRPLADLLLNGAELLDETAP